MHFESLSIWVLGSCDDDEKPKSDDDKKPKSDDDKKRKPIAQRLELLALQELALQKI